MWDLLGTDLLGSQTWRILWTALWSECLGPKVFASCVRATAVAFQISVLRHASKFGSYWGRWIAGTAQQVGQTGAPMSNTVLQLQGNSIQGKVSMQCSAVVSTVSFLSMLSVLDCNDFLLGGKWRRCPNLGQVRSRLSWQWVSLCSGFAPIAQKWFPFQNWFIQRSHECSHNE